MSCNAGRQDQLAGHRRKLARRIVAEPGATNGIPAVPFPLMAPVQVHHCAFPGFPKTVDEPLQCADVPPFSPSREFLRRQGGAGCPYDPLAASARFSIPQNAGPLSTVSKRMAYVLQDTDRRQPRAYDVFFAPRRQRGPTAAWPASSATDSGKQGHVALTIGGENQNAYANQCPQKPRPTL